MDDRLPSSALWRAAAAVAAYVLPDLATPFLARTPAERAGPGRAAPDH